MLGRITDRRKYPVPLCRFEPDLGSWRLAHWGEAAADAVRAAQALGALAYAVRHAPAGDLERLAHAAVWQLGAPLANTPDDGLQLARMRAKVWHPAHPVFTPSRPSMAGLARCHRTVWAGHRQAGKPRATEIPSAVVPNDGGKTPCLAPSPRDVLRLGASIDEGITGTPDGVLPALVGSAWFLWAIESTAPLSDGNRALGLGAAAAWLCHAAHVGGVVLDLNAAVDHERLARASRSLAESSSTAPWCSLIWSMVDRAARDSIERLEALDGARSRLLEAAGAMRAPRHPCELVHHLMASPITDVRCVERALGITFAAANDLVERCVDAGLVREITGRRRGRIYRCDASVDALGNAPLELAQAMAVA